MRIKDYDWHVHEEVSEPLWTMLFFSVCMLLTGMIMRIGGEPLEKCIQGTLSLLVVTFLGCMIMGLALARECRYRPWRALVGTRVRCNFEFPASHRIDRYGNPVWQWMRETGIPDEDVLVETHISVTDVTFRSRRHAALFKLAWGNR